MLMGTPYTPPVTRATFRRTAIAAVVVAVVALAVLVPMGYGLYALFGCVGLALGIFNNGLVMRAVANFAATSPSKGRFAGSVLFRLGVITIVALGCAFLFRPWGITVAAGLAIFQFLAVASSMLPLIKEIRQR
ncbi:hypothetical protein [Pseudonocardia sp. GCM10023141]|uniref:hypothetical protein n=1 Tax=Pseudonocardia sp. GCM10023141 TaxID=3252653 RepID=UPI0036197F7A